MKISIITTTLNSDKSLAYTLSSVMEQTYKNFEHIIVDAGSVDETINILKKYPIKNKKIFLKKNSSIYEAINFGIDKSCGDYIIILHSDDILYNSNTIYKLVKKIKKNKKDTIILGSVHYYKLNQFQKSVRYYPSIGFKTWMFRFGLMPPHTAAIIPNQIAKKYLYNSKFTIASDFDFFLKILKIKKINYKLVNNCIVRMRTGGISGKNIFSHIRSSTEILTSLKNNKIYSNIFFVYSRFIFKFFQFFYKKKKLENFKIKKNLKKYIKYDFKILNKIKLLDLNKNFVLSGLNLAFLGSLASGQITFFKELIHWPDGIFTRGIVHIKKIPGREILNQLKLNSKIKRVVVLGNIKIQSEKFLKKKFNKPIFKYYLGYGNIEQIMKKFKFKPKKSDIIFITLPTPKQEQLARDIAARNKNFRIICIGGSINIASGLEVHVPKCLSKVEFIWRLRYETLRRLHRLFSTFFHYILGQYILGTFHNLTFKIIK